MKYLLNLLAAIALLVWAAYIVRTGIMRVFGVDLRTTLAASTRNRIIAAGAGTAVTTLLQSSTATCLLVASFVGQGLIATAPALAIMLGADVGTALVAAIYSNDLSWLSPLLIFGGVVVFISRETSAAGRLGRVAIGLGLITLALKEIVATTGYLVEAPAVKAMLGALPNEVMLCIFIGALLTVLSYSSLAIVLLAATLAASSTVPLHLAFGLVLGANLGSGMLAWLATTASSPASRRVPLGNLIAKIAGCAVAIPLLSYAEAWLDTVTPAAFGQVVGFHLLFNVGLAVCFLGLTTLLANRLDRWLIAPQNPDTVRPNHLDPGALDTPSLAISCAAREALHQADVVEFMLRGLLVVIRTKDLKLAENLRRMDDTVDALYTAIKHYMTKISHEALSVHESKRWADIISFTINMEQIADIIEGVLQDVEDKIIHRNRAFSPAGMAEVSHLHERLLTNLRQGMSVFLDGQVSDAQKLLKDKADFRDLEREYARTHLSRLRDNTPQSVATSSLHLDLIGDFRRINSHICSVAYPVLEAAGALVPTRNPQVPANRRRPRGPKHQAASAHVRAATKSIRLVHSDDADPQEEHGSDPAGVLR